jgi:hypothetical protein
MRDFAVDGGNRAEMDRLPIGTIGEGCCRMCLQDVSFRVEQRELDPGAVMDQVHGS